MSEKSAIKAVEEQAFDTGVKRENGKNQALRHNEGSRCSGTANQVKGTPDFFVACWVMQWPQPALGSCFQHRVGILAKHVDVLMQ